MVPYWKKINMEMSLNTINKVLKFQKIGMEIQLKFLLMIR